MLRRNGDCSEMLCGIVDIIDGYMINDYINHFDSFLVSLSDEEEPSFTEESLLNYLDDYTTNNYTNHINSLLVSLLDEEERNFTEESLLNDLIYEVVYNSESWSDKFNVNEEKIKEIISEVRNISDALGSNTSFTKHLTEMIKGSKTFITVKQKFTFARKKILSAITNNEVDTDCVKEYYENFFASCLSQITPEFYFILKGTNILTLISRYNENDRYLDDDLKFKVVTPLCEVLETLLIEEKSKFFDYYF